MEQNFTPYQKKHTRVDLKRCEIIRLDYLEVASILPDIFRKIEMSFTHYHVTFRCRSIVGIEWKYILKNIQAKLTK
jgi:hypothetical protein